MLVVVIVVIAAVVAVVIVVVVSTSDVFSMFAISLLFAVFVGVLAKKLSAINQVVITRSNIL